MPNHVTNIITASEAVIAGITRARASDEGEGAAFITDFSLVIPEPENVERGACPGGADASGIHQDGTVCWYQWRIDNWGTKWGGYGTQDLKQEDDGRVTLTFETAWSHPFKVIESLSRQFPEDVIEVKYADEDMGSNCGSYVIEGGVMDNLYQPDYSEESKDFASWVKYGMSYREVQKDVYGMTDEEIADDE